jgi:hypothetical protein
VNREDITFIIPVYRLNSWRERTFWFTLSKILETGCKIIIVQQKDRYSQHILEENLMRYPVSRISYYDIFIDDDRIHKSKLINHAASKATTKFAWVNDIDCYLKFTDLVDSVPTNEKFIQPFVSVKNLTESETRRIFNKELVGIDYTLTNTRQINMYGALSFIFNIQTFKDIGGMNERYIGWGYEDYDLFSRVIKKHNVYIIGTGYGVHLWHPEKNPNPRNFELFLRESDVSIEYLDDRVKDALVHIPAVQQYHLIDRRWREHVDGTSVGSLRRSPIISTNAAKVIHVVNLIHPNNINNRVELTLQSIDNTIKDNTILLGCVSYDTQLPGWEIHRLERDSKTEFNTDKDFAFLKDMLDAACRFVEDRDFIFYSNMDCPLAPDIYKNILESKEDVIVFHRRDVDSCTSLEEIFSSPYTVKETGVDGLAIRKSLYIKYKDRIQDFLIGEPHWDTTIVNMFKKFHYVKTNTKHMYHIVHEQAWDTSNLSRGGEWNTGLYSSAKKYGLIDKPIISLDHDDILIIIDPGGDNIDVDKVVNFCVNTSFGVIVILELIDEASRYSEAFMRTVNYFSIRHQHDNTKLIDQSNALINIGCTIFDQYDGYSVISAEDIHTGNPRSISKGEYLDVYDNIDYSAGNERDRVFINDTGLLEAI